MGEESPHGDQHVVPDDLPTSPGQPHVPDHLVREAEFKQRLAQQRARRWRHRRRYYAFITVVVGIMLPLGSVLFAASIASGDMWYWASTRGMLPLLVTGAGCGIASIVSWLFSWGIIRGMIAFAVVFIMVVTMTRTIMGDLLPAMPGLVSLFIMTGALVGYLIVLEEGE